MKVKLVNIASPSMNAGEKAKNDIIKFLSVRGIEAVNIPVTITPEDHGWQEKMRKVWAAEVTIPREIKRLNTEDVVILQYPIVYSMFIMEKVIASLCKHTHAKLVFIIHDLESLRQTFDGQRYRYFDQEMSLLKQADGIIAHNKQMIAWLREQGISCPLINLQLFDYDNPQAIMNQPEDFKTMVFAGNLEKSSFLTRFQSRYPVTLYGMNPGEYTGSVKYSGQFTPEELPKHLKQGFGLVWDGPRVDTCAGDLGNYMRFNNPHKVSLYLSSGLPVIIWEKAALASIIAENNIGFTISCLSEIDGLLDKMTEDEYRAMRENVDRFAHKIRSGAFISQAIDEALNQTGYKEN